MKLKRQTNEYGIFRKVGKDKWVQECYWSWMDSYLNNNTFSYRNALKVLNNIKNKRYTKDQIDCPNAERAIFRLEKQFIKVS